MGVLHHAVARHWWNLHRFGLTPSKLWIRAWKRSGPIVMCNCIPKSGTHLLERTLCLHPLLYRPLYRTIHDEYIERMGGIDRWLNAMRPGHVYFCHLPYREELVGLLRERGVRCVFMIRDLRDILISDAFYARRSKTHWLHEAFSRHSDIKDCLHYSLRGETPGLPSFGQRMAKYVGWLESGAHVVRFEDLIGAGGGGGSDRQRETVQKLFSYLDLDGDPSLVKRIASEAFSDLSPTFRSGRIGGSRKLLDEDLSQAFADEAGDLLKQCGYAAT